VRLYLDNSVLNRPFDDQGQARIWLEKLAFAFVLSLVEFGEATLLRSPMHDLENERNGDPLRRAWVSRCLDMATINLSAPIPDAIRDRASLMEQQGLKAFDALHLAFAEALKADVFMTCDDKLIRRYSGGMKVQNPAVFITGAA
jgi:predicted nucleic acid-binding protein